MNLDRLQLVPQATAYARSRQIQVDFSAFLGDGTDGAVWATSRRSALKIFYRYENFRDELECYQRLKAAGWDRVGLLYLPTFVDADASVMAIEIGVVKPPRLLDFGKVHLDQPPPYWGEAEIRARFDAEGRGNFGAHWPDVLAALEKLRAIGIYYVDPKPGNIVFGDEQDDPAWDQEPKIDYGDYE